jgi:hypothetical protein
MHPMFDKFRNEMETEEEYFQSNIKIDDLEFLDQL